MTEAERHYAELTAWITGYSVDEAWEKVCALNPGLPTGVNHCLSFAAIVMEHVRYTREGNLGDENPGEVL